MTGEGSPMKAFFGARVVQVASLLAAGFLGYLAGHLDSTPLMQSVGTADRAAKDRRASETSAPTSRATGSGSALEGTPLPAYPPGGPGVRTPFELWRYASR